MPKISIVMVICTLPKVRPIVLTLVNRPRKRVSIATTTTDGYTIFKAETILFKTFPRPQFIKAVAPIVTILGAYRFIVKQPTILLLAVYPLPLITLPRTRGSTVHLFLKANSFTPKKAQNSPYNRPTPSIRIHPQTHDISPRTPR